MSPPAIGILPAPKFIAHRVTLEPGDRLFLYTDGITETTTAEDEEFGKEQLARTLTENRFIPLQQSIDALLKNLADWRGGVLPADDLSLVAVACLSDEEGQSP